MTETQRTKTIAARLVEAQKLCAPCRRMQRDDSSYGGLDSEDVIRVGREALTAAGLGLEFRGYVIKPADGKDVEVEATYALVGEDGVEGREFKVTAYGGTDGNGGRPGGLRGALTQTQAIAMRGAVSISAADDDAGAEQWAQRGYPGSKCSEAQAARFIHNIKRLQSMSDHGWGHCLRDILGVPNWYERPHVEAIEIANAQMERFFENTESAVPSPVADQPTAYTGAPGEDDAA